MPTVRELTARYDMKFNDKGVKKADNAMSGLIKGAQALGAALAGAFVIRGIANFANEFTAAGDLIAKTAKKLGVTTDALQEMRFAAELTGVSVRGFDVGFQRFTRRMAEAAQGLGETKKVFKEFGIQLKDDSGNLRTAESVLDDVADVMASIESPADRVRLAFKLFDTEGVDLVNTLSGGSEKLREMREEARELGGVIENDLIKQAEENTDTMLRWRTAMIGVKATIARALLPFINKVTKFMIRAKSGVERFIKSSNILSAALLVLSVILGRVATQALKSFVAANAGAILTFLKFAGILILLILIVDDLLTLFQGGKSVIGDFIDSIIGPGGADLAVKMLKDSYEEWIRTLERGVIAVEGWGTTIANTLSEATDGLILFTGDWMTNLDELWDDMETGWTEAFGIVGRLIDDTAKSLEGLFPQWLQDLLGFSGRTIGRRGAVNPEDLPPEQRAGRGGRNLIGEGIEGIARASREGRAGGRIRDQQKRGKQVEREVRIREIQRERGVGSRRAGLILRAENNRRRTVNVPTSSSSRAQQSSPQINQSIDVNMSIDASGGGSITSGVKRAGRAAGRDVAGKAQRATIEAVRQRVGG